MTEITKHSLVALYDQLMKDIADDPTLAPEYIKMYLNAAYGLGREVYVRQLRAALEPLAGPKKDK